jgi:hypothetical protein
MEAWQQRPSNNSHGSAGAQALLPTVLLLLLLLPVLGLVAKDELRSRAVLTMKPTALIADVLTSCMYGTDLSPARMHTIISHPDNCLQKEALVQTLSNLQRLHSKPNSCRAAWPLTSPAAVTAATSGPRVAGVGVP